ncbi:MAG: hypothetical protein GY839_12535 [candidate division Zixibacteria bacterium]|nr:hypothetical protein [candidate division Zixibacteria bacterium]
MSINGRNVYEFIYRGHLAKDGVSRALKSTYQKPDDQAAQFSAILSLDLLDNDIVQSARQMSVVYTAVAAFENSVRDLISEILLEAKGENWWKLIPKKIRENAEKRLEEEKKVRWHTQRGEHPINYTTLANLLAIMRTNFDCFEPHIESIEWAANIFDAIERSRNVITHSGVLQKEDVQRLGIYIRDWIRQVGV